MLTSKATAALMKLKEMDKKYRVKPVEDKRGSPSTSDISSLDDHDEISRREGPAALGVTPKANPKPKLNILMPDTRIDDPGSSIVSDRIIESPRVANVLIRSGENLPEIESAKAEEIRDEDETFDVELQDTSGDRSDSNTPEMIDSRKIWREREKEKTADDESSIGEEVAEVDESTGESSGRISGIVGIGTNPEEIDNEMETSRAGSVSPEGEEDSYSEDFVESVGSSGRQLSISDEKMSDNSKSSVTSGQIDSRGETSSRSRRGQSSPDVDRQRPSSTKSDTSGPSNSLREESTMREADDDDHSVPGVSQKSDAVTSRDFSRSTSRAFSDPECAKPDEQQRGSRRKKDKTSHRSSSASEGTSVTTHSSIGGEKERKKSQVFVTPSIVDASRLDRVLDSEEVVAKLQYDVTDRVAKNFEKEAVASSKKNEEPAIKFDSVRSRNETKPNNRTNRASVPVLSPGTVIRPDEDQNPVRRCNSKMARSRKNVKKENKTTGLSPRKQRANNTKDKSNRRSKSGKSCHKPFEDVEERRSRSIPRKNRLRIRVRDHLRRLMEEERTFLPSTTFSVRGNFSAEDAVFKPLDFPNLAGFESSEIEDEFVDPNARSLAAIRQRVLEIRHKLKDRFALYRDYSNLVSIVNAKYKPVTLKDTKKIIRDMRCFSNYELRRHVGT